MEKSIIVDLGETYAAFLNILSEIDIPCEDPYEAFRAWLWKHLTSVRALAFLEGSFVPLMPNDLVLGRIATKSFLLENMLMCGFPIPSDLFIVKKMILDSTDLTLIYEV